ncbi:MAG: two-component system sensor histidine kinase PilS (NtrC family) [Bradymonadia bacterium]
MAAFLKQPPSRDEATSNVNSVERATHREDLVAKAKQALRDRLEWLMLFRLILVTFLLGSAVLVNVNDVDSFGDPSYVAIVSLIVGTYLATLGYVAWLRLNRSLEQLAYLQLVGDTILAAGLVLLTGGIHSIFTFLFFLGIFTGAVLRGRAGAMFAASGASLGLAVIVILQFGQFQSVAQLLPATIPRGERVPVYALIIHLVGFFTVAALSGYLSEKLGQVGSELERRQLDIKELRALNENIVRSLTSGLVTVDERGHIVFFNEAAEEITGRTAAEVNLQLLSMVLPQLEPVIEAAPQLVSTPNRPRLELRYARPDESMVHVGVSITPLRSVSGRPSGYIVIMQDITSIKALEAKLLRQEHLSAIGKLSAGIAHEIRNPLAAISGSIEMLRMMLQPPEEERQLMDIVIREVDRLNGLIAEFLDYARTESYRTAEVNLAELMDETLQMFRQDDQLAEFVDVELDEPPAEDVFVNVDLGRLKQVLWNLLRNASEAMEGDGCIQISRRVVRDKRTGRLAIDIVIDDDGPGLPEDVLPKLFEPFFTTKDGGTGLGLATCHRIVTAHDGALEAASREEGGARFVVRLPCSTALDVPFNGLVSDGEELLPDGILTERMDTKDLTSVGSRAGRMVNG